MFLLGSSSYSISSKETERLTRIEIITLREMTRAHAISEILNVLLCFCTQKLLLLTSVK
jgi:hypothetical protein